MVRTSASTCRSAWPDCSWGPTRLSVRREAVPLFLGLLAMENSALFAGFAIAPELPMMAELAVVFDVLIVAFVFGILTRAVHEHIGTTEVGTLTLLKEESKAMSLFVILAIPLLALAVPAVLPLETGSDSPGTVTVLGAVAVLGLAADCGPEGRRGQARRGRCQLGRPGRLRRPGAPGGRCRGRDRGAVFPGVYGQARR